MDTLPEPRIAPVDYASAATQLLETLEQDTDQAVIRSRCLLAARIMRYADSAADRIDFVRDVYGRDLQGAMEAALSAHADEAHDPSLPDPDIFTLSTPELTAHLDSIEGTAEGHTSPKRMQKMVSTALGSGYLATELTQEARSVSVAGPGFDTIVRDPTKIERFQLQQFFIDEQIVALLGEDADLSQAPFTKGLLALRHEAATSASDAHHNHQAWIEHGINRLERDINAVFVGLSQPITERYVTGRRPEDGYEGLTFQQAATVRFREVTEDMRTYNKVSRFVDSEAYDAYFENTFAADFPADDTEIWASPTDARSLRFHFGQTVRRVLDTARQMEGDQPTAEELHSILHDIRSTQMLRNATLNVADMTHAVQRLRGMRGTLARDEAGMLMHSINTRLGASNEVRYAGTTLGCVALRVTHPERRNFTDEQRSTYGSANLVDHLLAIAINEAYARGLLDLRRQRHQ